MSWPANNLTRIHCTGDSITSLLTGALGNYPGVPGGLIDQMRAKAISFAPAPTQAIVPGRVGQVAPTAYAPIAARGRRQVVTVYGVGGRTVAGLQADLQASVYCWAPDILIIELGTNDFGGAVDVTPGGAFQTSYAAVLDGVHTTLPNCKVLCLSPPIRSEVWTAGNPPHMSGGLDTWAGLARVQELCNGTSTVGTFRATYPAFCEYVDVLTPAFALNMLLQPNAGASTSPYALTQDSLHPTPLGKVLIGTIVMQHLAFS